MATGHRGARRSDAPGARLGGGSYSATSSDAGCALGGMSSTARSQARPSGQRQGERERRPATDAFADDERAAHRLRELRGDGQAEADAVTHVARHERPQDRRALGLGDAGACVAHDHVPDPFAERHVDRHLAVGRRRVQGVRDEVGDDLQDAIAVAAHDGRTAPRAPAA